MHAYVYALANERDVCASIYVSEMTHRMRAVAELCAVSVFIVLL